MRILAPQPIRRAPVLVDMHNRRVGAADVQAIHADHAATIAPMAARLAEAARHELAVSNLVLDAYGMSAEERTLMWRTAPPRVRIAPP